MERQTLDFAGTVAHVAARVGSATSVVVTGRDPGGEGVVADLTGTLRAVGPDPDDPHWSEGPAVFSFEGQESAFYLDPEAFVSAWTSGELLHVNITFGSLQIAGPLERPTWF